VRQSPDLQISETNPVNQALPEIRFTAWFSFFLKLFVIYWWAEKQKAQKSYDL
jgi:hypothetical protein